MTAGDLTLVGGLYFKATTRIGKAVLITDVAVNGVGAGAAAYQYANSKEGRAAHAGEFILRLAGMGLGANSLRLSSAKAKIGKVASEAQALEKVADNAPNRPVHIDIGGEGRYPNAINVNPNTNTSTTGTAGRTIPNRVPGRGESLPFGARHADGISLENAPITAQTAAEIARVIKPGGSIRLVSPSDYAAVAHKRVIDAISGCNVQQSTINGITTTTITVPR
jgi:hypothetical protein